MGVTFILLAMVHETKRVHWTSRCSLACLPSPRWAVRCHWAGRSRLDGGGSTGGFLSPRPCRTDRRCSRASEGSGCGRCHSLGKAREEKAIKNVVKYYNSVMYLIYRIANGTANSSLSDSKLRSDRRSYMPVEEHEVLWLHHFYFKFKKVKTKFKNPNFKFKKVKTKFKNRNFKFKKVKSKFKIFLLTWILQNFSIFKESFQGFR